MGDKGLLGELEDHPYGGAEFNKEWHYLQMLHQHLTACLWWCAGNFSRDSENSPNNFAVYLLDDIGEACLAVECLASEGLHNACRRELRYLLEVGLKACFVVENNTNLTPMEQVTKFRRLLESPRINPINTLELHYFEEKIRIKFLSEFKRLYGELSKYAHLSSDQIMNQRELHQREVWRGQLDAGQQAELNSIAERCYALTLSFYLHSLPQWVAGDLMAASFMSNGDWHYLKSKFIAAIDSTFDYKHERQAELRQLVNLRAERIAF